MTDSRADLIICSGDESEAPRLSRLAAELFHQAYGASMPAAALESFIEEEFRESRLRAELLDPDVTTLLMEVDGILAGYAQLRLKPVPVPVDADVSVELWRIYIDRLFHGKGIGRRLLASLLEIARDMRHERIWLGVWERNPGAIAFYEKNGFSVVGSQPFVIGDEVHRDLVMIGSTDASGSARL